MGAQGNGTIDFGATPADEAVATVTTSGLLSTSDIEAWFQHGDSTADNTAQEHEEAGAGCPLACKYVSGTSFEVKAQPIMGLGLGTFKFRWTWN